MMLFQATAYYYVIKHIPLQYSVLDHETLAVLYISSWYTARSNRVWDSNKKDSSL